MINGNEQMWLNRHEANMGRTRGLHEEQRVTQEAGISVGFSLNQVQSRLAPCSDRALKRLIRKAKEKEINIKTGRK